MSGYDIYKKTMSLLGYTNANGDISGQDGLMNRALDAVNQIGADLCAMTPLSALTQPITADIRVIEAMPYGVGMLLALSEGDGEKNRLFCEMYNAKRAAAKAETVSVNDVLPTDDGGCR